MSEPMAERVLRSARLVPHGGVEIGVLRHRVDVGLVVEAGRALAAAFRDADPSLVMAPAVSGVTVATIVAAELGVPLLLARKDREVRGFVIHRSAYSSSEGMVHDLYVARDDLLETDRVLIVDDMIQHGQTTAALLDMVQETQAKVVGIAAVVEVSSAAREKLTHAGLDDDRIKSLVQIDVDGNQVVLGLRGKP